MSPRSIARSILLGFVVFSLGWWAHAEWAARTSAEQAGAEAVRASPDAGRRVVAYYFHGKVRCQSCVNIERYSREAIGEGFPSELAGGLLEFRDVVVQDPGNEHYMDDYQLSSWALVLVEYRDGRQTRWKNADRVWELVLGDPSKFRDYVKGEVREFLAAGG